MQDLSPPDIYYYETAEDPTQEALEALLLEDGAELSGNVLGVLVKTPPGSLFGVERYDFEVYYGDAYETLTANLYRNRTGFDWLTRGAQDGPQALIDNLQTTVAEVAAGREPFAWQAQQLDQTDRLLTPVGLGFVALVVLLLVLYRPLKRLFVKRNRSPDQKTVPAAQNELQEAFLNARYNASVSPLAPQTPEAVHIRKLLFGGKADPAVGQIKAELGQRWPVAPPPFSQLEGQTPFDAEIRVAFAKLYSALQTKRLEIEKCFYNLEKLAQTQSKVAGFQSQLEIARAEVDSPGAHDLLSEQSRRLEDIAATNQERAAAYQTLISRLEADIEGLEAAQLDLLKKREVYALVEASLELQRDLSREDPIVIAPSNDIKDVLMGIDDLIEAYMELSVPSYNAPPLPDVGAAGR